MNNHFRLTQQAYEELEKQLGNPYVGKDTSASQACFMLGQQSVLKILRDGFTIGERR